MEKASENEVPVRLIASGNSWIEGEAVRPLHKTAELPGMLLAVGLPDLHPGRGTPVGAVFVTRDMIYPHLVGNDVGCGMGLWATDLAAREMKRDKWVKKLAGLESPWEGDADAWLGEQGLVLQNFNEERMRKPSTKSTANPCRRSLTSMVSIARPAQTHSGYAWDYLHLA